MMHYATVIMLALIANYLLIKALGETPKYYLSSGPGGIPFLALNSAGLL